MDDLRRDFDIYATPLQPRLSEEARARVWLKAAVLIGLGLYFIYNIYSGNLANYINARFAWLSYVAAGLFLLLGLCALLIALRANAPRPIYSGRTYLQISWAAIGFVALPLVLGTLVPSRPLGVEAISGNIALNSATAASTTQFTINPLDRNILDWLRVFNATTDYKDLEGQPADVIGFVYNEPTFGEDQFMVARFTVSCCVADASAIGLPTRYEGAADLPLGQWVRVRGTITVGDFRGDSLPILEADSVEFVEQPQHPYLYP